MFQPRHYGLYFSNENIQRARTQQNDDTGADVWAILRQRKPLDLMEIAQWSGLLFRFADDVDAGSRAVEILQQGATWEPGSKVDQIATLMTWAQCFEMVRDHPQFGKSATWLEHFAEAVSIANAERKALYVEQVWLNALNMAASIVLEDEHLFTRAATTFKEIIQRDVHPDGYIRPAAEGEKGLSLHRMLLTAQALILTAEAASHVGEDLWTFSERGVSALTPTPYLLYYYYYPEKWRWDADIEGNEVPAEGDSLLSVADIQALYRRHGGLWEMAQRRSFSKDRQMLLNDLRPVVDVWGGGLVTLTHGFGEPTKRRFGLF